MRTFWSLACVHLVATAVITAMRMTTETQRLNAGELASALEVLLATVQAVLLFPLASLGVFRWFQGFLHGSLLCIPAALNSLLWATALITVVRAIPMLKGLQNHPSNRVSRICMRASHRKWIKRISLFAAAVALLLLFLPFMGPRHQRLDRAGVWWYRSYNGGNWSTTSLKYSFRVSPRKFAELQRELHLKRTTDDKVFMSKRKTFTSDRNVWWFRMKWKENLELYQAGTHGVLCRDPDTGFCVLKIYDP